MNPILGDAVQLVKLDPLLIGLPSLYSLPAYVT